VRTLLIGLLLCQPISNVDAAQDAAVPTEQLFLPEQERELAAAIRQQQSYLSRAVQSGEKRIRVIAQRTAKQAFFAERSAWADAIKKWRFDSLSLARIRSHQRSANELLAKDRVNDAGKEMLEAVRLYREQEHRAQAISTLERSGYTTEAATKMHAAFFEANKQPPPTLPEASDAMNSLEQAILAGDVVAAQERLKLLAKIHLQSVASARAMILGNPPQNPERRLRNVPCPPVAPSPSSGATASAARLDPVASRTVLEFYPRDARRENVQGAVSMRLKIGSTGCVEAAELLVSSGFQVLDEAALSWVFLAARFFPALQEGKATESVQPSTVNFSLVD
jgi:TonB family protein